MLTDFQNLCIAGKRTKFATKPIRHYQLTTSPWACCHTTFGN